MAFFARSFAIAALTAVAISSPLLAETPEYEIIIKDHKFTPAELKVPAGQKVKLKVVNQDPTPEEFESHDMNREKIINGNSTGTVFIGPLEPGTYSYFGEFNEATAQGKIIAE